MRDMQKIFSNLSSHDALEGLPRVQAACVKGAHTEEAEMLVAFLDQCCGVHSPGENGL